MSFGKCAEAYIIAHRPSWKSAKHAQQWVRTLQDYAYPLIGTLPVDKIDTGLVMRVLEPIWHQKPETAKRVRGRIELVLDWAKARGFRGGENPARWKGHIQNLLPKRDQLRAVKHHPALPYREIARFIAELRQLDSAGARALELLILCASRSSEVLEARWEEFKLEERVWVIPAARMKGGKEHRVPLSGAAMAILEKQAAIRTNNYVFPGAYGAKHIGTNALSQMILKRLGRADVTPQGFRSTFADWCTEVTEFSPQGREIALAHTVGNKVEEAYRRGDQFAKRRALAEAWAAYCAGVPVGAEVVDLVAVRSA